MLHNVYLRFVERNALISKTLGLLSMALKLLDRYVERIQLIIYCIKLRADIIIIKIATSKFFYYLEHTPSIFSFKIMVMLVIIRF